jgi:hypothetical protein
VKQLSVVWVDMMGSSFLSSPSERYQVRSANPEQSTTLNTAAYVLAPAEANVKITRQESTGSD